MKVNYFSKKLAIVFVINVFFILSFSNYNTFSQTFPSKPIEIIVGWPPGGSIDTGARIVSNAMKESLGQPFIISIKPGAGGAIAAEYVARAKPDGYTIVCSGVGPNVIVPAINLVIKYGIDDFIPIGAHGLSTLLFCVKSTSQFNTIQDLIKYGKENPGKLTYGTGGVGAPTHMFAEVFKKVTGIKAEHIAFKGGVPVTAAAAGGHIDFGSSDIVATLPQLDAKRVRGLVVSGTKRDSHLPDLPCFVEIGYPEASFDVWQGFSVAKGTPQSIVKTLSEAYKKAVNNPSVQESLYKAGLLPGYISGEELERRMPKEFKLFRELAEEGGFLTKE